MSQQTLRSVAWYAKNFYPESHYAWNPDISCLPPGPTPVTIVTNASGTVMVFDDVEYQRQPLASSRP